MSIIAAPMLSAHQQREFWNLVVEKKTKDCWSWIGPTDADFRPVFHGEKAYRHMYELRVGTICDGFHVHHKCGNSSCVNPRHLVALPPEAHRLVHSEPRRAAEVYATDWSSEAQRAAEEQRRIAAERAQQERVRQEQERRATMVRELEKRFGPSVEGVDMEQALERLSCEPVRVTYDFSGSVGPGHSALISAIALLLLGFVLWKWHLKEGWQIVLALLAMIFSMGLFFAATAPLRFRLAHRQWAAEMRRIVRTRAGKPGPDWVWRDDWGWTKIERDKSGCTWNE